MYLVFLGESGNTGVSLGDPNQPHHVHTGLMLHESQAISVAGEFNALCRRHFGRPLGEPGTPTELRPTDIYQGRGAYASWLPDKRGELIQDCLGILIRRETPLIAVYVNKQEFFDVKARGDSTDSLWGTPSAITIDRFLLALNMFVDEVNMSSLDSQQLEQSIWPIADFAMVVARGEGSVAPGSITQFMQSDEGQDTTAVLNNLCFAGPEHSVGIQLANLCAYFTRRWLQNPSAPHPYFEALRDGKVVQVIYPVQF